MIWLSSPGSHLRTIIGSSIAQRRCSENDSFTTVLIKYSVGLRPANSHSFRVRLKQLPNPSKISLQSEMPKVQLALYMLSSNEILKKLPNFKSHSIAPSEVGRSGGIGTFRVYHWEYDLQE